MKKIVKRPDGTEEVIEGTAEELAEYDRKVQPLPQNETPKKGKRVLLSEEKMDELLKILGEIRDRPQPLTYQFHSHCTGCIICRPQPQPDVWPWPQITYGHGTIVSDKIELQPTADHYTDSELAQPYGTSVYLSQADCDSPDVRAKYGVGEEESFVAPGICINMKS